MVLSQDHASLSPFIPPAEKTTKHANTCAVQTHVNYIVALGLV